MDNFILITGGPGSGKTSLVAELEKRGYFCAGESGRAIIKEQLEINGDALPWKDPAKFAELMFRKSYLEFNRNFDKINTIFFDRGIPDDIGYLRLCGLPIPEEMLTAAKDLRYNRHAFIASPWKEIYVNDEERKQDFDEAVRTYKCLVQTYSDLGYELIVLPKTSITERANFVLMNLSPKT